MKVETAIARILASNGSVALKILKLQNLALRCAPSSHNQKKAIEAYKTLERSK